MVGRKRVETTSATKLQGVGTMKGEDVKKCMGSNPLDEIPVHLNIAKLVVIYEVMRKVMEDVSSTDPEWLQVVAQNWLEEYGPRQ